MTKEYLEYVKDNYENWVQSETERITKHNLSVNEKIMLYNKIHSLLNDENVKEFANMIGYVEDDKPNDFEKLDTSLTRFLSIKRFDTRDMSLEEYLKIDKYPVFCFVKTMTPKYGKLSGTMISDYDDIYYSLEYMDHGFVVSNLSPFGISKNKFKNKYDIIYAPEGKSFSDKDTFYDIQAEYVEEAIKTDQNSARKMILSKYGRK